MTFLFDSVVMLLCPLYMQHHESDAQDLITSLDQYVIRVVTNILIRRRQKCSKYLSLQRINGM